MNDTTNSSPSNGVEKDVAALIVEALLLEDVDPTELNADTALFTDESGEGLGLDSIDVLELAMALNKRFGVKVEAENENNRDIFATVGSLAAFVRREQQA